MANTFTQPKVLIILVSYNGIELTLACLRSLQDVTYACFDVVLVDNASRDGTPEQVRAHFPNVRVVETGINGGFASGNNVGLRVALAEGYNYALLLNNDTEVAPDFLDHLVAAAEADVAVGVVGPTITYFERPDVIWSAGGCVDWQRGISAMRGLGETDHGQYAAPTTVDFVTGCALLCKRAVLERVGFLDERFFMYFEETEWCVRATRAGFRCVHVPAARVLHKIPLDGRADQLHIAYYMTRNRLLFLQATRAATRTWRNATLQDLRTCMSLSLRPKWRARRQHRDAMVRAWSDYWRGRFGALNT